MAGQPISLNDVSVDLEHPSWYLAYSLSERLAAHRPASNDVDGNDVNGNDVDGRAARRLARWKDELAIAGGWGLFERWLASTGLDENTLLDVLGETPAAVRNRFADVPEYVRTIARAWQNWQPREDSSPEDGHAHAHVSFTRLTMPLVADGVRRIQEAVRQMCAAKPSPYIEPELLVGQLCVAPEQALNLLIGRALVLELNILRIQGELDGDTSALRFKHFVDRLHDPGYALRLLMDYPVLARDATRIVENWANARIEFAARLVADVDRLMDQLGHPTEPGVVVEVSLGAGDSHRDGRSVGVVSFSGGARVVYKPRGLSVDLHFQRLLRWLNERGAEPGFQTLWLVDRGIYGWSEFVEPRPCEDQHQLRRFYTRHGGYLALLYSLAATDFHLENVIAAGEHPILVDLEALFHPAGEESVQDPTISPHAYETLRESVLNVGLLPTPILFIDDDRGVDGVDFSGLAGASGQQTPTPIATWEDIGTDQMRLVRRRVEMEGGQNLPSLVDDAHNVLDYGAELAAGFQSTYRLLRAHRDGLLASDGPVAAFADDEVRVILRGTRLYIRLIQESRHPDLLRNALDRDRFFTYLWLRNRWPDRDAQLAAAEQAQLSKGDVPIFTTRPADRSLVAGDGTVIADVLETSGLERARARIADLSEEHLAQQTWFLQGSLAALAIGEGQARWPGYRIARATAPADGAHLLATAVAAGDRLLESAAVGDGTISWLGLTFVGDKKWQLGPTGIDLYSGISGIALFLGYLGAVTGECRFRDAAQTAANVLANQLEELRRTPAEALDRLTVGAFNELGGPLYTLSHLGTLWQRSDLLDAATAVIPTLRRLAPEDRNLDIISGSAGAILALLSLHQARASAEALDAAGLLADNLIAAAEQAGEGIGWRTAMCPARPLAGFSHGASGIGVALARLDRALGHRRHVDLIRGGLRLEESMYDPSRQGWLDLRDDMPDRHTMVAWCHGAPGIALARADLLGYLDEQILGPDLDRAIAGTLASGLTGDVITGTGNHSICHGDLGNVEALTVAARRRDDADLAHHSAVLSASVLSSIEQDGWLCGVPLGAQTPGLMSGVAGIGYNLLRLAQPERVPSVLLLEGPVGA